MDYLCRAICFLETYNGAVTAVATVFIAVFTIVLAYVTSRQARLTKDAVDLGRAEFIASHRPKLVVRQVEFTGLDANDDSRFTMRCAVANIGDSEGRLIDGRYHVEFSDGSEFKPIENGDKFDAYTIAPGAEVHILMTLNMDDGAAIALALADQHASAPRPYFRGYLLYQDRDGVARRTYFSRRYEPASKRFMPTSDPDYDQAT